jgi:hypothetical protein
MSNATHKDGGPAFPHEADYIRNNSGGYDFKVDHHPGMTLRDYFAGQALMGILNNAGCFANMKDSDVAENAYHAADAMLTAREKGAK